MNGDKRASVRVTVDPARCVGSGTCIGTAPGLFDMSDAGTAEPMRAVLNPDAKLDEAVSRCPAGAIEVTSN
jgi:ferredoxin